MTETTTAAEADVPSLLAAANLALNALHECIVPKGAELQISDAMRALRSAIDANLTSAARPLLAAEHMAGLSVWGNLFTEAARTIDSLLAEKDRLTACLEKANSSAEHFEREWYLRGDELETLRAQLAEAQEDEKRLDWLEAQVNKNGELHLHDGNHARGIGVGLRPGTLVRTLRAAIDAAKGEPS